MLGDIKGESPDDKHKDEIEVLSISWGLSNSGSMSHGTGGGEGKASFSDLSFMHTVDKASPVLMQACALGTHLKDGTITHRKSGKGQQEYLIVKMNERAEQRLELRRRHDREREPRVRQGRRRVQAAEAGRIARRRHLLQVRPQGPEGRLTRFSGSISV